jgi:branched-chain amino acid transport system permease protein
MQATSQDPDTARLMGLNVARIIMVAFAVGAALAAVAGLAHGLRGVAEALATFIPGQFGGSAWKDVWAFVLLILVLVFRPQGLLGARVVDRA